jgi:hypothetical protein
MSEPVDAPLSWPGLIAGFLLSAVATGIAAIPAVIAGINVASKAGAALGFVTALAILIAVPGVLWFAGRGTGARSFATGALIGGGCAILGCGMCFATLMGH